jgi:hypothetical protein
MSHTRQPLESRRGGLRIQIACLAMVAMIAALGATRVALAADPTPAAEKRTPAPPKKPDRALQDSLLEDLDNELLEGAGDLKDRSTTKQADVPKGEKPPVGPAEVGEDIGMPAEDEPLARISQEMRTVESLISGEAKGGAPEPIQRKILEELAKLIEDAEKQRAAQQQSSAKSGKSQQVSKRQTVSQPRALTTPGKPSTQPAQDSTDKLRQSQSAHVDPAAVRAMLKETWGNLPSRAREQMLQNTPERFLPQYELLIERYYKRLAEEQSPR